MASASGGFQDMPVLKKGYLKIAKVGYLKRQKTYKWKWFVLRAGTLKSPAQLECYDSEKKWRMGATPKRVINLSKCLDVNKKEKQILALYTYTDHVELLCESDEELMGWLRPMLLIQQGEAMDPGLELRPKFEHIWAVNVKKKELGARQGITGDYWLCLTPTHLTLIEMSPNDNAKTYSFSLSDIRRHGHMAGFFFIEMGSHAPTGEGKLYMEEQHSDDLIAQSMHVTLNSFLKGGDARNRLGSRPPGRTVSDGSSWTQWVPRTNSPRDRTTSQPNRSRTVSEGQSQPSGRPLSSAPRTLSCSPPVHPPSNGSPSSPSSSPSLPEETVLNLSHHPVIAEERLEDYVPPDPMDGSVLVPMGRPLTRFRAVNSPSQESIHSDAGNICQDSEYSAAYMPHDPLETTDLNAPASLRSSLASVSHSLGSSVAEDNLSDIEHAGTEPVTLPRSHSSYPCGSDPGLDGSPTSSCSVLSGTPSTGSRLEPVRAWISGTTTNARNRAQSMGSQMENLKPRKKFELMSLGKESSRLRAFSLGSRSTVARPFTKGRAVKDTAHGNLQLSSSPLSKSWSGPGQHFKGMSSSARDSSQGHSFTMFHKHLSTGDHLRNIRRPFASGSPGSAVDEPDYYMSMGTGSERNKYIARSMSLSIGDRRHGDGHPDYIPMTQKLHNVRVTPPDDEDGNDQYMKLMGSDHYMNLSASDRNVSILSSQTGDDDYMNIPSGSETYVNLPNSGKQATPPVRSFTIPVPQPPPPCDDYMKLNPRESLNHRLQLQIVEETEQLQNGTHEEECGDNINSSKEPVDQKDTSHPRFLDQQDLVPIDATSGTLCLTDEKSIKRNSSSSSLQVLNSLLAGPKRNKHRHASEPIHRPNREEELRHTCSAGAITEDKSRSLVKTLCSKINPFRSSSSASRAADTPMAASSSAMTYEPTEPSIPFIEEEGDGANPVQRFEGVAETQSVNYARLDLPESCGKVPEVLPSSAPLYYVQIDHARTEACRSIQNRLTE